MSDSDNWLYSGRGASPALRWSFYADAPLADVRLARESGEIVAADVSGSLYLLDRLGQVQALIRSRRKISSLTWADVGGGGAAVVSPRSFAWIDRKLQFTWTRDVPDDILTIAMNPHGTHVAVSMIDGVTLVYSADNRRVSRFETVRPLRYLSLLATEAHLLAAAEHGLVGRYTLQGRMIWTEKLWSNVGDLAATGDGKNVFLAGFSHGVQSYDGQQGTSRGAYLTEGNVAMVSCGYAKKQFVASTLERDLFSMSDGGEVMWSLTLPEDIVRLILAPLCDWLLLGFSSGRIVRLDCQR